MTAPTFVQAAHSYGDGSLSVPAVTFGASVTTGNLLVAAIFDAQGDNSQGFNSAGNAVAGSNGWTLKAQASDSGNGQVALYTRTALNTDGTTPPMPVTGNYNSFDCACHMVEVGSPGLVDGANAGALNTNTGTTTGLTTAVASDLCLLFMQRFFSNGTLSTSGGSPGAWSTADAPSQEGAIGHQQLTVQDQVAASSSATVDGTITGSNSGGGPNVTWAQITIKPAAGNTETGNVTMHFGGIAIAAGGSAVNESAAATMNFGAGIGLKVNVIDVSAEPSLVNFYTF